MYDDTELLELQPVAIPTARVLNAVVFVEVM